MKNADVPSARDQEMISPSHKIEFFEVSSYGTLGTSARPIGKHDATTLLEETLNDEERRLQSALRVQEQIFRSGTTAKRRRTTRIR